MCSGLYGNRLSPARICGRVLGSAMGDDRHRMRDVLDETWGEQAASS